MIKSILDEIAEGSGSNKKMEILGKYKDNELLVKVIYLALSKRVKFYIKQIPEYTKSSGSMTLEEAVDSLNVLSSREKTGHDARDFLINILESLNEDDAYVIERIIDKSLKIDMGSSFVNKVIKDLIEKTPYQGAQSFSEKLAKTFFFDKKGNQILDKDGNPVPVKSDVKMDGRYANALIRGGEVELESRNGETTYLYGTKFAVELSQFHNCVLNGELTMDGVDRYTSNGIIASLVSMGKKKSEGIDITKKIEDFEKDHMPYQEALDSIRFTCWDVITIDEYFEKKSVRPYSERLEKLNEIIQKTTMISVVETKLVYTYQEAMEHFVEMLDRGEEGTILKKLDAEWKNGKPNWQMKMKLVMDVDLRIKGYTYGEKGKKNENVISTIICESECGLVKSNCSNMKEEVMEYVTEHQDELMDGIIEMQSCGLTQDRKGKEEGTYSLLHPAFNKFRDDKDTADDLESIRKIEEMAKTLKTI